MRRAEARSTLASVGPAVFRSGMRRLAGGVALVTSRRLERSCGLTATSCVSVSLDPPLVLVAVDARAETAHGIEETGAFGVSLLPADHEEVSRRFATARFEGKFVGVEFRDGVTGVPILAAAHASLECVLWDRHPAGDHVLYIGRVVAVELGEDTEPLVYHEGRYAALSPSEPPRGAFTEVATATSSGLLELLNESAHGWGQWSP